MSLSITLTSYIAKIGESITITGSQDTPSVIDIVNLTHVSNIVTVTTSSNHGIIVGRPVIIAETTVSGYHGIDFTVVSIISPTIFTYELTGSLADATGGTVTYDQIFNIPHNKNVVTFNGVVANILFGTDKSLNVIVPQLAEDGYVAVETFLDVTTDNQRATSPEKFDIQYDDDSFPDNIKTPDLYHKGYINNRVKTLYTDPSPDAIYNRDFSYSNFVEIVDENSMVQNFLSLILTSPLDRMWEPEFGSSIPKMPFQLISSDADSLAVEILNEAERLINTYEKRITLIKSQSIVSVDPDTNRVDVIFAIRVPTGNVKEVGVTLGHVRNETM
jgi:phage baseplate assembly protein W